MFADRREAGEALALKLLHLKDKNPAVFALARGGVPVGFEIAVALSAPLDAVLVRKIGAPYHEELAIGAVADAPEPEIVINQSIVESLAIAPSYIERIKNREIAEIARRKRFYFRNRPRVDPRGKTAIVVDDGIATGATMRAALRAIRRQSPTQLVLAVPVAAPDTIAELRSEADEAICLYQPEWLGAIGMFYRDFSQVSDEEVVDFLERAIGPTPANHSRRTGTKSGGA
jgi:putative phosphoribosyl transferase